MYSQIVESLTVLKLGLKHNLITASEQGQKGALFLR